MEPCPKSTLIHFRHRRFEISVENSAPTAFSVDALAKLFQGASTLSECNKDLCQLKRAFTALRVLSASIVERKLERRRTSDVFVCVHRVGLVQAAAKWAARLFLSLVLWQTVLLPFLLERREEKLRRSNCWKMHVREWPQLFAPSYNGLESVKPPAIQEGARDACAHPFGNILASYLTT